MDKSWDDRLDSPKSGVSFSLAVRTVVGENMLDGRISKKWPTTFWGILTNVPRFFGVGLWFEQILRRLARFAKQWRFISVAVRTVVGGNILELLFSSTYVRTYVCTYVRTYVRTYERTYVRTYVILRTQPRPKSARASSTSIVSRKMSNHSLRNPYKRPEILWSGIMIRTNPGTIG